MSHQKKLRLRGRGQDGFVIYRADREDDPCYVRIESVALDGEICLSFTGDNYRVWRESIYTRGEMRRGDK